MLYLTHEELLLFRSMDFFFFFFFFFFIFPINRFQNVPDALIKMSRTKMNKLFAGYEGDPGELGPEMMKRCSTIIFLAGHYAMRSPLCLQQLNCAMDAGIPVIVCNIFAGIMPDFIEETLKGATFIDFVPSFMPATIERGQASFDNSFEAMVEVLHVNEKKYVDALPVKMTHMIGEDADAFALEQVDGKFFVLVSHGGNHREFATTMKHELEQSRMWCFISHGDEHMDRHQRQRFQKAMENCMVYCPILSQKALECPELLSQIQLVGFCFCFFLVLFLSFSLSLFLSFSLLLFVFFFFFVTI